MTKLKIGIAGAGYIGSLHAAVLSRDERVTIAAVHDIVSERAQRLAAGCGASVAGSSSELLERVDAVYVSTPNTMHTQLALEALSAGKHVFCEKPMATTVDEARRIVERAS